LPGCSLTPSGAATFIHAELRRSGWHRVRVFVCRCGWVDMAAAGRQSFSSTSRSGSVLVGYGGFLALEFESTEFGLKFCRRSSCCARDQRKLEFGCAPSTRTRLRPLGGFGKRRSVRKCLVSARNCEAGIRANALLVAFSSAEVVTRRRASEKHGFRWEAASGVEGICIRLPLGKSCTRSPAGRHECDGGVQFRTPPFWYAPIRSVPRRLVNGQQTPGPGWLSPDEGARRLRHDAADAVENRNWRILILSARRGPENYVSSSSARVHPLTDH